MAVNMNSLTTPYSCSRKREPERFVPPSEKQIRDLIDALKALEDDEFEFAASQAEELHELHLVSTDNHDSCAACCIDKHDNCATCCFDAELHTVSTDNHDSFAACCIDAELANQMLNLSLLKAPIMHTPAEPQMLLGGMVTVVVGQPGTEFFVHEKLITERSDFFKNALKPHMFREGVTKRVHLPSDEPYDFACLVHWMYTGTFQFALTPVMDESELATNLHVKPLGISDPSELTSQPWAFCSICKHRNCQLHPSVPVERLFELWILGDKLQMARMQDDLACKLIELGSWNAVKNNIHRIPSDMMLEYVYANTLASSPLRRLAIDLAVLTRFHGDLDVSLKHLPEEIVRDIAIASLKIWKADAMDHKSPPFSILGDNEHEYKVSNNGRSRRNHERGGRIAAGCGYPTANHASHANPQPY